ncbi:MAG: glycosyltransferase family 39 protein, partial [Elusimicrobia bacterium]|nr:glycosyltransferase family 39 protein [Elusimicrobiota bacterium]
MTMEQNLKRRLFLAAGLAALALFLGWEWFALKAYVRQDAAPPSWDQSDHLSDAWDYRQALERGRWSVLWTLPPKPGMPPFPPLYALSIMGSYSSPKPAQAALLINWFYLALLCLSVFGIAWEFRPDFTALAAAIIFAGAPAVQDLLFTQLMDLAVVAFAAAAYWALIRSEKFKRWPGSLAFGALFAAGMLYKWSFFSYLLPAFWVAGGALRDPERRPKVLTSAGFALAGFAPWYFAEAPLLLPKLIQASADQSVAFWRGGAVLAYFKDSINGLGLPFFLLGWLSLLSPRHKRRWESMRLLPAWIAASYLFWTVVPNRQMRFLLPGLPALAVCAASAWPDLIVWPLAGFQLLSAANFPAGVIPATSVPMPLDATATLLPSRPPSPADWKIADILKTADELRDPQEPFANATLVANAPQFNGPTFAWEDQRLGLSHVKMRAVNHRLCELSQFVILKEGSLGPPAAVAGLPEAAVQIQDPH